MPESLNFDRVAELYDETRGGEERGRRIGVDIAKLLRADRPVLEVGVGTGVISKALKELGFDVYGDDISAQMLARAKSRIGPRVVQGDAMRLPVRTGSFDQVVIVWVLHVVADPTEALREVARVLAPHGRCLVVDGKNIDDPDDPLGAPYRELERAIGRERPREWVAKWASLAPDAGFTVDDIVTIGPYPFEGKISDVAENIASRAQSWMWNVPDDLWERSSAPIVDRLRARPDKDVPITVNGYQEVLVLSR